jgi:hypothetical protein
MMVGVVGEETFGFGDGAEALISSRNVNRGASSKALAYKVTT